MNEPDEDGIIELHSPEEIPVFANEDEEAEFWATHGIGSEFIRRAGPVPEELLPPTRPRSEYLDPQPETPR